RQEPFWVNGLLLLSSLQEGAYTFLPILLLGLGFWLWRHPRDADAFLLLMLLVMVVGSILLAALGNYAEFYRMRVPMDWAMIAAAGIVLLNLFAAIARKMPAAGRVHLGIASSADAMDFPVATPVAWETPKMLAEGERP